MPRPNTVRVIAGSARGRRLVVPEGPSVRPTKDMVREAIFSALDARHALVDASVLDLFAGSGALAIEALSRGAEGAVLVEQDRRALEAVETNLTALGFDDRARVARADAVRFLQSGIPPAEAPFDLVFVDPPYDTADVTVTALLAALTADGWLAPGAFVCVERGVRTPVAPLSGLESVWQRTFGDTLITFLQP